MDDTTVTGAATVTGTISISPTASSTVAGVALVAAATSTPAQADVLERVKEILHNIETDIEHDVEAIVARVKAAL